MLSPRLRFIAAHNTGLMRSMGLDRAYKSLLAMANEYERQLIAVIKLHAKVPNPLDPNGFVCSEDGDIWPCNTRRVCDHGTS